MYTITLTRYSLSVDILVLFFEYFLRTHHLSQQTEETREKKYATHSQHTNTYIYFIYRFISIFLYANKIERESEKTRTPAENENISVFGVWDTISLKINAVIND